MTMQEALEHWRRTGRAPDGIGGRFSAGMEQALRDAARYGTGYGTGSARGFEHKRHEEVHPPQHGAVDFRRRPDGVWEMP